jgi:transposase
MDTLMSQQEVQRAQVLDLLQAQHITQQQASQRLAISTRQVRRLAQRYYAHGLGGLISQQRGKASNHKLADATAALPLN